MAATQPQALPAAPATGRPFDGSTFPAGRYPHLQAVFERMMASCADYLRQISAIPAQYALNDVQTERFGAVLDRGEGNAVAAVFYCPEWDSRLLFLADRGFIFTLTEILFGGDGSEPPYGEQRAFSAIETSVARAVLSEAAQAFRASLAPVAPIALEFERVETRMEFAVIERRTNPSVVATLGLTALGRGGELQVVIPQSALNSVRQTLGQPKGPKEATADPGWSQRMQSEIRNTDVTLTAILDEQRLSLAAVAGLRVGQVLRLDAGLRSRIRLECNNRPLFWCEIGQADGAYTLRVEGVVEKAAKVRQ